MRGRYVVENGVLISNMHLKHNPWSYLCAKRVEGEPFDRDQKCPLCDKPYEIEEMDHG